MSIAALASISLSAAAATAPRSIDLSGTWSFALDREDKGTVASWFAQDLPERIELPGVLQAQGYGDPISTTTPWVMSLYDRNWFLREPYLAWAKGPDVKVPFLSQPPRHFLGAAWYQREIEVPENWAGQRLKLFLERARWKTTVWLDENEIGSENTLVAPHQFELGEATPGRHRLTIRVDNRMIVPGYRPDAHAVSDSLGGTWNGITGRIELSCHPALWLDEVQVFADAARRVAVVRATIGGVAADEVEIALSARDAKLTARVGGARGNVVELEVPFPADTPLWSEFTPAVQTLRVELATAVGRDEREVTFGFRNLTTRGTSFLLNGRDTFMRGTHHGGDFPLTGYPPSDVDYWRKLFRTCRTWGLNHMRFHSFCPPEAAFVAADEIGFYLQPECGMWNDINPGSPMEQRLYDETARLLRAYGNHPSFMLLSPSNEPGGGWRDALPKWVAHFRALDRRHLYTTGTGWSIIPTPGSVNGVVDYLAVHRFDRSHMMRGASGFFGRDYEASMAGVDVPNIVHEAGQWCAYPDFDVMAKFTGYLRPGNLEIARDWAASKGLLERNKAFARASGRFQVSTYKEEIEAILRTKSLRGFQLLDLHDYLGQGTALVGVLDAFWEEKGYIDAPEWRRFCSETVPLARLATREFTTSDTFDVPVEIAHFGPTELKNACPFWRVVDEAGHVVAKGEWTVRDIPIGSGTTLGHVTLDLGALCAPGAFKLVVGLDGTAVENDWNFWVYPVATAAAAPTPEQVRITRSWAEAEARLAAGERVLFMPHASDLDWTCPPLGATPVFWNRLMGPGWDRMLGLCVDANHPALAAFPTADFGDWQWIEIVHDARALNLDHLPSALQPIVQPVDDWNRNYKLGLVFECRVGAGRLLVTSIDLKRDLESRPVARQLRASLLAYMASDRFAPSVEVEPAAIRSLLFDNRIMTKLGAEPLEPGMAERALDGDPNTFWLSGRPFRMRGPRPPAGPDGGRGFDPSPPRTHPHDLTVRFPRPVAMRGLVLMPWQSQMGHIGDIREYAVAMSDDGETWREVVRGELPSSFEPKTVLFPKVEEARFLRLTALSGFGGDTTASLAELAVLYAGPPLADEETAGEIKLQRAATATPEIEEGTPVAPPRNPPRP